MNARLLLLLPVALVAACGRQAADPAAAVAAATGCGEGATGIVVTDAWVRAADAGRPATALYLTLCNAGAEADALIGAAAPGAARTVELHETTRSPDGVMQMNHIERFPLAPASPFVMAPGGSHVMLIGLNGGLTAGATATVTLEFETSPPITIDAPVRTASEAAGDHH